MSCPWSQGTEVRRAGRATDPAASCRDAQTMPSRLLLLICFRMSCATLEWVPTGSTTMMLLALRYMRSGRVIPCRASQYVLHLLGGRGLLAEDVVDVSEDRVRSSIARQLTEVHRVVRQQDGLLRSSERNARLLRLGWRLASRGDRQGHQRDREYDGETSLTPARNVLPESCYRRVYVLGRPSCIKSITRP